MDLSMPGPGATAAAAVAMPQQGVFEVPAGMGFADPTMQQQHDGRISYDAGDAHMAMFQHHQFHQHTMPSALLGRKHAPDRRPLRFWQPFNDWWRSELTRLGRRPTSEEIGEWYMEAADRTWGETKPTLQETRVHAKCLRSLPLVRDYFRNYRAKKKAKGSDGSGYDGEDTGDGDTEDGTDNGGSSRLRQKPVAKRARLGATPSNSNPEAVGPSHSHGHAKTNNSDPGASAAAGMAAGSYGGLDMLQAYQAQYWDSAQNEEYARQAMLMQQMALYQQLAAAQQLSGDVQYALLAQQQQQAAAASDPAKLDEVTSAVAAALAKSAPESHCEPGSGAAADDEHVDHEPRSASGATQPLPRHPANTDTATSNTTSHPAAAAAADATLAGMAAEEAVSQHRQGASGSLSRDGTPQHEGGAAGAEAAKAAAGNASAALSPADGQQHQQQQPSDAPPSDGWQEQAGEQGAQPMEAEGPGAAAGDGKAPAAETGSGDAAPLGAQAVPVKAEEPGMRLGGDGSMPGHVDQQQPSKPQEKQQQQSAMASKSRQQAVELDLRDPTAHPDTAAEAVRALQQLQQPQHASKAVASGDKPATPADLQAALFSAAAAAAAGHSMASTAAAAAAAAPAAHGPTTVSPYVQGMSAAAAAALTGGLNLADSPLLGAAVSQEEPHPGAQLPEAAAAALAAAPMPGSHPPAGGMEHRANTFGVEGGGGGGAMADIDEVELLNDVEMGGMSHGELVAHIRRVQQELLSKRELLTRSFDQLRRTQDRLARRERKLAKEQQKCKQYQNAVATWQAAWQAAALPSLDPAAAQEAEGGAPAAAAADDAEEAPAADAAQAVQQQ